MSIQRFKTGQILSSDKNGWHFEYHADGTLKTTGKLVMALYNPIWSVDKKAL